MTSESALRHIPEDTLEQYCMGHLSEAEAEPVEEHLLVCNLCQDACTETADFLNVVRAAAGQLESEPVQDAWWKRVWHSATAIPKPVFAMAACALALFVILPTRAVDPAVVDLQTMRGPEAPAQAPANAALSVRLAVPEARAKGSMQLRLADANGTIVYREAVQLTAGKATAKLSALKPGAYWVRLYSDEELVQEYALSVR